jgi:hypothetical protein
MEGKVHGKRYPTHGAGYRLSMFKALPRELRGGRRDRKSSFIKSFLIRGISHG